MTKNEWFTTSAGVQVPWIVYGTAWKQDRTADLVVQAILAGFRGIDTACQPRHYRESMVGDALQRLKTHGIERETLYLQTKFTPIDGQDPSSIPYDKDSSVYEQVKTSFEVSLTHLQTTYIDTFILHSPLATFDLTMEAWSAMEMIQKSGGARQLGLSNCYSIQTIDKIFAAASVKPVLLQNRFYQETDYDCELRQWCSCHGMLYQSFWTLTANPHKLETEVIQAIAKTHKRTGPQVFFRFLHQLGIVPLTGTCSEQHMSEDLSILDFELSDAEMEMINLLLGLIGKQ
jgi:diketogulonate reductase-like aldo/keto reductase